jgi:predicted deacetylase
MIFAIRDDDICFFTNPKQLEQIYGDIWRRCPVSLSVVPFQSCTRTGAIPSSFWAGDRVFPVGDNHELVDYLRERSAQERIHIMLHGYSHRDEPEGYEFQAGKDLTRKLEQGMAYLRQVFGRPVTVFVPPHNALSRQGYEAFLSSKLVLSGRTDPRTHGLRGVDLVRFAWIRSQEKARRMAWPMPIRYSRHTEIGFHSLTPLVSVPVLIREIEDCHRRNGVFVLATHYWEFGARMMTDASLTLADAFRSVWRRVEALPDVRFASLGDLG